MSQQVLPGVDIQLTSIAVTLIFFVLADLLHSSYVLSRHSSSSIFSPFCCDIGNNVLTNFLSHLLGCLS